MSRYVSTPLGEDPPPPTPQPSAKAAVHHKHRSTKTKAGTPSPGIVPPSMLALPDSALVPAGPIPVGTPTPGGGIEAPHKKSWLLIGGLAVGAGTLVWLMTRGSTPRRP
jgi:hypothetical protein